MNAVSIGSWNINGVWTNIENTYVQDLLMKYDVIGLSEAKTNKRVSLPDYVCYRNTRRRDRHRGGVIVFVHKFV